MKGLRLYLPPFAPDTAGAASVLYPLGGLVVIVDAGGCAGNICGFDEPRFFSVAHPSNAKATNNETTTIKRHEHHPSIFTSAALRDMDAILGRDAHLLEHIEATVARFAEKKQSLPFLALIGTPVPAVIGTDLSALARLLEKRCSLPAIAIETDGTEAYDNGIQKAYAALFSHLARIPSRPAPHPDTLGVLGATTLDFGDANTRNILRSTFQKNGAKHIRIYGLDFSLDSYIEAAQNERNLVLAPSGLPAARWLQRTFGTPYEIAFPLAEQILAAATKTTPLPRTAKNILILHQQMQAGALRNLLQKRYPDALITCATYFQQIGALTKPQDIKLREGIDLPNLVAAKHYDLILADPLYQCALPNYHNTFLPLPHPAVSGF